MSTASLKTLLIPVISLSLPLLALYVTKKTSRYKQHRFPRPPGPRGISLIKRLLSIPKTFEWVTFRNWCFEFDTNLLFLNIPSQPLLIINRYEEAVELLTDRSGIYSSRPSVPMLDLAGISTVAGFAFAPYGALWRSRRRLCHQVIRYQTVSHFSDQITDGTRILLESLLDEPQEFLKHINVMGASTMSSLVYGRPIHSQEDEYLMLVNEFMEHTLKMTLPGSYLVNTFPILQRLPNWCPGTVFRKDAKKVWDIMVRLLNEPFNFAVKGGKSEADQAPSTTAVSILLDQKGNFGDTDEHEASMRAVAMTMFTAGFDTMGANVSFFFLAMTMYPEVQLAAQHILPSLSQDDASQNTSLKVPSYLEDKDWYPYITALLMELLRWGCVAPLGIPHKTVSNDIYKEWFIPLGTIVMANQWAMMQDETVYSNPRKFDPTRFLTEAGGIKPDIRSPMDIIFGFGRRICQGRYLAIAHLWTTIASILTLYTISSPNSTSTRENNELPEPEIVSGIVVHPAPFKCTITPRYGREVIKQALREMSGSVRD